MDRKKIGKTLSTILSRLGLIVLGLLLGSLSLELIFRWLYPDPTPRLVNQALQLHDTYGISFTPNAEGWNTSLRGEYSCYITINSKGLRGREYPYQKETGTFRILVLGDSFTAGLQVEDDQLFTTLLEKRLNDSRSTEVINAGVVGYGTANELAYFVNEGHKYQPDLVLLIFFTGNDIQDNISPAHYKLEAGKLVPIEFVYNPAVGTPPWAQKGTPFRTVRNYLYTHSRLYSVAIELLAYTVIQRSPELSSWLQRLGFVEAARPVINAGNIYSFLQPSQEAWEMTEALISALNEQVKAYQSELAVVILPDETEVDVKKWQNLFATYPDLFEQTNQAYKPTDQLAQLLEEKGISYLNLRTRFEADQQAHQRSIYFQYDGHWKPTGHALTAEALADYITQNGAWLATTQPKQH